MGSAWQGDWEARISEFAADHGFDHIWYYLLANPNVPLVELARRMPDIAAVQLERVSVQYCQIHRQMARYIRDAISRRLSKFKGSRFSDDVVQVFGLRPPYSDLAQAIAHELRSDSIPLTWNPAGADDEILVAAGERALESLAPDLRDAVLAGKTIKQTGDDYWAAVAPIWDHISIYDGAEVFESQLASVRYEVGLLFAAHWCQSEIRNGGFHQFFVNPTGILAPEAAEAFAAIGMPTCSTLIRKAMGFFADPYPREKETRNAVLREMPGETRAEFDPFYELDDPFYAALRKENGGFLSAADEFARRML